MERNRITRIALATSLFLTSCSLAKKNEIPQFPLATPTIISPTPVPGHEVTPTPTPHSTPMPAGSVRNLMTGAVYQAGADPDKLGRQCLKVEKYTSSNPQTVDGAAVALGTNPGIYVDTEKGEIYSNGTLIGSFTKAALPDPVKFGNIQPSDNIVVCDNSGK